MKEKVLVTNTIQFQCLQKEEVFFIEENFLEKQITNNSYFIDREKAESNIDVTQIIPYVIFKCKEKYFVNFRTSKQSEKRLHNIFSLGFGGHINPSDGKSIINGRDREISEEISKTKKLYGNYIGVIKSNKTEVSKCHLAVCYLFDVDEYDDISIKETEKLIGMWMNIEELKCHYELFENWSQILIDYLKDKGG